MDPRLKAIVDRVAEIQIKDNPAGEFEVDGAQILQLEMLRSGIEFTEDDVIAAFRAVGVPDDDIVSTLEDFASYI